MKRVLIGMFVAAAAVMLPAMSIASPTLEASEQCGADDNAGPIYVEPSSTSSDSGRLVLCNDDDDFPLQGNITLQGDLSERCGSASIDGDEGNPEVDLGSDGRGDLDGYAALEADADRQIPAEFENFGDGDYSSDCPAN